jgi:2-keto-4-pentenoate hydratase/2-oxohepta-3-ene-1,7-dioic acid hydratase in catechol pathway
MKLASYVVDGVETFGVVRDGGVVTLGERLKGRYATLRDALAGDGLKEISDATRGMAPDRGLSEVRFLPVIPNPDKVLCVGLNYRSHAVEIGREPGEKPSVFVRLANTLVGHEGALIRPSVSKNLDFEGELAVIIGRGGRHISLATALDHVAGYSCFVDGTVRDFSKHSLAVAKNFVATAPLGPWLVTRDEITDPTRLTLQTRLNGKVMQNAGTEEFIHSIPEIIAYCSIFTPLRPGDIIATGTPAGAGVGRTPPIWLEHGDRLELEISAIGTLRSIILREDSADGDSSFSSQ